MNWSVRCGGEAAPGVGSTVKFTTPNLGGAGESAQQSWESGSPSSALKTEDSEFDPTFETRMRPTVTAEEEAEQGWGQRPGELCPVAG